MNFIDNKARIIILVILVIILIFGLALWQKNMQAPSSSSEKEELLKSDAEKELQMLQEQLNQLLELQEQLEGQ